jgi:hypothetical protein
MFQVTQEHSRHNPVLHGVLDLEIHWFRRLGLFSRVVVSKGIPARPVVALLVEITNPQYPFILQ